MAGAPLPFPVAGLKPAGRAPAIEYDRPGARPTTTWTPTQHPAIEIISIKGVGYRFVAG